MKYLIRKEDRPAYLRLYNLIRDDIVNGHYPLGAKLPSKRTLAAECGVSTVTVEHAYALLCDEGYLLARERSGFTVIFRKSDGFARTESAKSIYHEPYRRQSELPEFPLSVLSKTMRQVLSEHGNLLLEKSPNLGCTELREAIRRYLARSRGITVSTDQIVIGSGSEYLYGLITELLGRDRIYAIESPSYKKIEQVYRASEVTYRSLSLTETGIDSSALSDSDATVLHVTPYRSYPSGVTASASKRHEYLLWAERRSGYIIEDDFESEFSLLGKTTETLFSLSDADRVIYLNTFSRTISPSLRIGYMVLPKHLTELYADKLGFYSCTVPTFMQYVLTELIDNGDFERHINRVRRQMRKSGAERRT